MPAVQGLKMIFDHDDEEEQELEAFDGVRQTPLAIPSMNLVDLRRSHQQTYYDSSSSDAEGDNEEDIRTDIIKFKRLQQQKLERAQRKAEKLHQKKVTKQPTEGSRGHDKYNGFVENKSLPCNRRVQEALYYDNDSEVTASEPSNSDEDANSPATLLMKAGLGEHWVSGRFSDSSSSEKDEQSLRFASQSGWEVAQVKKKPKKQSKGVLGANTASRLSIDAKFTQLQKQLLLKEQMKSQVLKEQYMQKRNKKRRRGKLGKEIEAQDNEMLDELFGGQQRVGGNGVDEEIAESNLGRLKQEGNDSQQVTRAWTEGGQPCVEIIETRAVQTSEEHRRYLRLQEELRIQKKLMKRRYDYRLDIDEFVRPILNIDILDRFADTQSRQGQKSLQKNWEMMGMRTHETILPTNFQAGHFEYFQKWEQLFLYETYSMLLNSRRSDAKEEDHAQAMQRKLSQDGAKASNTDLDRLPLEVSSRQEQRRGNKCLHWIGYIVCGQKELLFQNIKMYERPPHASTDPAMMKPEASLGEFSLRQVREHDLLILSEDEIQLKGQQDIKRVSSVDFLRGLLFKHNAMFAFVTKKAPPSKNGTSAATLQVDISKAFYLDFAEREKSYVKLHCYHFENLATTVREYKTLKMSEFYGMAPILLQPALALENKEEMLLEHKKTLEEAIGGALSTDTSQKEERPLPMQLAKRVTVLDDIPTKMRKYARRNRKLYNPSQLVVLDKVIDMPENDILLIQGPPGTGKTHTITGIISMLLSSDVKKILVCAPSNAAIDEIVSRISVRGFIGEPDPNCLEADSILAEGSTADGMLLRLGAVEYDPGPDVRRHTLDGRLIEVLNGNKAQELKERISFARELIRDIEQPGQGELGGLDTGNRKHIEYLLKLVARSVKSVKEWIKRKTKEEHIAHLKRQVEISSKKLDELLSGANAKQGSDWKYVENDIITRSQIVCCTLAMAGIEKLEITKDTFDYLIVDEACQCIEPSTLIPFELGPKRVILVGDQNQLPATTFSVNSNQTHFSRSLFERLLQSGYDKTMLQIQYRMHPSIRKFPSKQFYENLITDHDSIVRRKLSRSMLQIEEIFGTRVIFFDVKDSRETVDDKSKCNHDEAELTKQLVEFISYNSSKSGALKNIAGQIGVISPYKSQVRDVKNRLGPLCRSQDCHLPETIEVNTVDAFQGREKDIIIFNCVRSNFSSTLQGSLGFLTDERRLNVAITRPRHFLFILGNASTLKKSPVWNNMITYCRSRTKLIQLTRDQLQRRHKNPGGGNLQDFLPLLLKKSTRKTANDDITPSGSEDEGQSQEGQKGPTSGASALYSNMFPEDQMKNELVRNLYKRAVTEEQRQELDLMVNDVRYTELKRQKK